jgi:hypothetical protein
MDGYSYVREEAPQLTHSQAKAVLEMVRAWIATTDPYAAKEVRLYEPGFHTGGWSIALEGGPYEWPMTVCESLRATCPVGVFAEPVNHWCLGLYPA